MPEIPRAISSNQLINYINNLIDWNREKTWWHRARQTRAVCIGVIRKNISRVILIAPHVALFTNCSNKLITACHRWCKHDKIPLHFELIFYIAFQQRTGMILNISVCIRWTAASVRYCNIFFSRSHHNYLIRNKIAINGSINDSDSDFYDDCTNNDMALLKMLSMCFNWRCASLHRAKW